MLGEALEIAKTAPMSSYEKGVCCYFIRLDGRWGIKLYKSLRLRELTYRLQEQAYNAGYAPMLGDKFEATLKDGKFYYGYLTECVSTTILQLYMDKYHIDDEDEADWEEAAKEYLDDDPEFNALSEALESLGFEGEEFHAGNLGYLPNGQLVAIDFSHEQGEPNDEEYLDD